MLRQNRINGKFAMIFGKQKNQNNDEEMLRAESYQKWRERQFSGEALEKVSEVKVKSTSLTAEWPDPKAEVTQEQQLPLDFQATSHQTNIEPLYKAPQSKLAQFVSTGLNSVGIKTNINKQSEQAVKPIETKVTEEFKSAINTAFANKFEDPTKVSFEEEIKKKYGTNLRSALGPGTIIEGTFSFDSPVAIEGTLIGEIRSNSLLIVGPEANVQAKVRVGSLVVYGSVQGDVEAEQIVEIKENGLLEGNIIAERLAIDDGGWFQGRCIPTAPTKVLENFKPKKQKEAATVTNNIPENVIAPTKSIQEEIKDAKSDKKHITEDLILPEDQIELSATDKWSLL